MSWQPPVLLQSVARGVPFLGTHTVSKTYKNINLENKGLFSFTFTLDSRKYKFSLDYVYTGKHRCRLASVLRFAFWRRNANAVRLLSGHLSAQLPWLLVHSCTYTLVVVFKSIYAVQKILHKTSYDLDLASPFRIRIDLCSRVKLSFSYFSNNIHNILKQKANQQKYGETRAASDKSRSPGSCAAH